MKFLKVAMPTALRKIAKTEKATHTGDNKCLDFYSVWFVIVSIFFQIFETRSIAQCAFLENSPELTLAPSYLVNEN